MSAWATSPKRSQLRPSITGIFGLLIDLKVIDHREVGPNPTSSMVDAFFPGQLWFTCVAGEAKFFGMDYLRNVPGSGVTVPGIRRIFTCYSH